GSYRRRRESIGDLDILVTSGDSATVMDRFVAYGDVAEVISKGETRATVKLRGGLQVDLRAVEPAAYGAALLYFTGSKAHNIELRTIAQEQTSKLNEYGLFKGTPRVAGKTEAEIYAKLGLDLTPPELRESRGELGGGGGAGGAVHHPEEHRARHPRDRQARPARRRARRGGLRRRHDPLRHEPAERGADAPAGGCGTAPLDRRHRPPHRPPARQARALSPRLRRAVPRLRGRRVPAGAQRPPRTDGSARHPGGRGAAAGRPLRALDRQP